MASITYFGVEKPQSTNFGVFHKNIETNLTEGNWENKATCRVHPEGILYIQIKEGRTHEAEKDPVTIYRVCAHVPDLDVDKVERVVSVTGWKSVVREECEDWDTFYSFEEDFSNLDEALKCANGEDEGELAKLSRPSEGSHEYPLERGGGIYITGFTRIPEGHLKSNFTVKVEDPTSNQD
ncbi:MAG: hypothetical protein CFH08_02220 [Alphaproteobacteria bacterium MarineAlpha3_Bin7]|nr:MAG: hypothetical protein CFH08_02220 [Alphaproteobacteria bacterium MarineAlpha3_Bin7]|tara:strand:- start:1755 stop:2294 length:540 start_codon:yes stop_codon:yes gene_type:complete